MPLHRLLAVISTSSLSFFANFYTFRQVKFAYSKKLYYLCNVIEFQSRKFAYK